MAKKHIDENYKWRNPTIIDRDPELIAFLKTKPNYEEARCYRKVMLLRRERFMEIEKNRGATPRPQLDLDALPEERHLTLVKL
ncbi:MAG: hypothetical protein IPM57_10680 [Oligoflexia bacterium]|nr:hypothetical protein [Oligoflexia bacterium]